MNTNFPLFPERASTMAGQTDELYFFLLAVTAFFTVLIFCLIVYFALRYRRRRADEVPAGTVTHMRLELTWTIIPFLIVMVMFVWGAKLYVNIHTIPEDAMQIDVVGKQWMWYIQHPQGRRENDELHVPLGQRIKLKMISQDVIHSFYIPAFRLKQDVLPGRYTYQWFEPTKVGEYHLFCAEYCGTGHSRMIGKVVVMEPADYQAWLSGSTTEPPAIVGERLFNQYGCMSCHGQQGPTLAGLYGRREHVVVENGRERTIVADDEYLRESILSPSANLVKGFPPIMPSFRGQLSEEQIGQLIAYIKTLGAAQDPDAPQPGTGGWDVLHGLPRPFDPVSPAPGSPATAPATRPAEPSANQPRTTPRPEQDTTDR